MADSHVISALVKKRAELRGDIIHYKQLIATLDKDLQTIDATIKIFDVDYDISSIKPVIKCIYRSIRTGMPEFNRTLLQWDFLGCNYNTMCPVELIIFKFLIQIWVFWS